MPRFQHFRLPFVDLVQMLCGASQKVSRSQDLGYMLSSYSLYRRSSIRAVYDCGM
jgi:hypothetical protein